MPLFGEIASRKIYLIKFTSIINWFNISDLLDVEKNPLGRKLATLTYNESVFLTIPVC